MLLLLFPSLYPGMNNNISSALRQLRLLQIVVFSKRCVLIRLSTEVCPEVFSLQQQKCISATLKYVFLGASFYHLRSLGSTED